MSSSNIASKLNSLFKYSVDEVPRNFLIKGKPSTGKSRLIFNIFQKIKTENENALGGFRTGDLRRLNLDAR